jgi:hypothetical protein
MTGGIAARGFASLCQKLSQRCFTPASRAMSTASQPGGHIETDMQEKRRADEDRFVRERDKEALEKLSNKVRQNNPSYRA